MKLRYQLFTLEPKLKKKKSELAADESDMDEEFMERHEEELKEKALDQAAKKFEKENLKLVENKEPKKPKSDLDERLKEIKAEFKALVKERKTKHVEPRRGGEWISDQFEIVD
jgi:DNA topoisomerase-1